MIIRARAFLGLGDRRAFASELDSALRRFPDDPSFARLFLIQAGRLPDSAEARELGINPKLGTYTVDVTDDNTALIAVFQGLVYRKSQDLAKAE